MFGFRLGLMVHHVLGDQVRKVNLAIVPLVVELADDRFVTRSTRHWTSPTRIGIEDERIAWDRLYMEPIEREGANIDTMVRETYRPPDER